jgi:hypothetical protein
MAVALSGGGDRAALAVLRAPPYLANLGMSPDIGSIASVASGRATSVTACADPRVDNATQVISLPVGWRGSVVDGTKLLGWKHLQRR